MLASNWYQKFEIGWVLAAQQGFPQTNTNFVKMTRSAAAVFTEYDRRSTSHSTTQWPNHAARPPRYRWPAPCGHFKLFHNFCRPVTEEVCVQEPELELGTPTFLGQGDPPRANDCSSFILNGTSKIKWSNMSKNRVANKMGLFRIARNDVFRAISDSSVSAFGYSIVCPT